MITPEFSSRCWIAAAHLIALGEGCPLVTRIWAELDHAQIGVEKMPILETGLVRRREPLGETDEPISYHFCTPWLGLNQDNHARYRQTTDPAERSALLERILIGNCLALAKAFGHHVAAKLTVDVKGLRPWGARLKKVGMEGFVGTFGINFRIPEHAGIGKSVSRGFGTVERRHGRGEERHAH